MIGELLLLNNDEGDVAGERVLIGAPALSCLRTEAVKSFSPLL